MLDWLPHSLEPPKTWADVAQIAGPILALVVILWGVFWAFVKFVWRRLRLSSQSRNSESTQESLQSVSQSVSGQGINTGDNSPVIKAGRDVYYARHDINIGKSPAFELSPWEHTDIPQGHGYRAILTVLTEHIVARVRVTVYARSIQSLYTPPLDKSKPYTLMPNVSGEGFISTTLPGAAGEYLIQVVTTDPETPRISAESEGAAPVANLTIDIGTPKFLSQGDLNQRRNSIPPHTLTQVILEIPITFHPNRKMQLGSLELHWGSERANGYDFTPRYLEGIEDYKVKFVVTNDEKGPSKEKCYILALADGKEWRSDFFTP